MKKKSLKFGVGFTICFNIILIIFIVVSGIFLNSYFPKTMTANEFTNYMEKQGCNLVSMQDEKKYEGSDLFLVSDMGTCPYLISYTIFNDKEVRDDFFKQMSNDVLKNNPNVKSTEKIKNDLLLKYYKYSTSGDYYKTVAMNNNSILYIAGNKAHEKDILKMLDDLGYQNSSNMIIILIIVIFTILMVILFIVCLFETFKKTRKNGYVAFIPIYNIVCLVKDVFGRGIYAILFLIPIINIVFALALFYGLGKVFGRKRSFCVLLMLLPTVFWPLLVYGNFKYKPIKETKRKK